MTTVTPTPDTATDVGYAVLCGTCPDNRGEHYACYAVAYDSGADLDGDPAPERLFSCQTALGETWEYAADRNRSFVPVTVSRLVPYCAFCGAAWHDCQTDWRGLCVQTPAAVA